MAKKSKAPKTFTLDISTWRCGGDGEGTPRENKLGRNATTLYDPITGKMCCIGQFSLQSNPEIKKVDLADKLFPECVYTSKSNGPVHIPLLNDKYGIDSTKLVNRATSINDNEKTTIKQKIASLRSIFGKKGVNIRVINEK